MPAVERQQEGGARPRHRQPADDFQRLAGPRGARGPKTEPKTDEEERRSPRRSKGAKAEPWVAPGGFCRSGSARRGSGRGARERPRRALRVCSGGRRCRPSRHEQPAARRASPIPSGHQGAGRPVKTPQAYQSQSVRAISPAAREGSNFPTLAAAASGWGKIAGIKGIRIERLAEAMSSKVSTVPPGLPSFYSTRPLGLAHASADASPNPGPAPPWKNPGLGRPRGGAAAADGRRGAPGPCGHPPARDRPGGT